MNFSTVMELLQNEGTFPQPRNFSTVIEIFYREVLLDQGNFLPTIKCFTVKEIFLNKIYLIADIFYTQSFPQTKIFGVKKRFSGNNNEKSSLKAKILDPFNTKRYAKIFLPL